MSKIIGYTSKKDPKWLYIVLSLLGIIILFTLIFIITLARDWIESEVNKRSLAATTTKTLSVSTTTTVVKVVIPTTTLAVKKSEPVQTEENEAGITVEKIVFASDIDGNLPADNLDQVSAAEQGKIYCYTRVNSQTLPQVIHHVWIDPDGQSFADIELDLSHNPADTWSYISLAGEKTGDWELQVQTTDGTVLAKRNFKVSD